MHHPSGLSYTDYDSLHHWQPDYDAWQRQWRRGDAAKPEHRRRTRKPTLASVAKQASKAGIEVARYEVEPDGKIVVVTGKPSPAKHSSWDDLETGTRQ